MPEVVALGTFDGVHIGHRKLIAAAAEVAAARGEKALVYTFSNHPAEVFAHGCKLLMTPERRIRTLSELCPVETDVFNAEYAAMPQEDFADMLSSRLHVSVAVAGFNYTFGRRGEGDVESLKRLGERRGFSVLEIQPCFYAGAPVSSTRIRAALAEGELDKANAMLGRAYMLEGVVIPERHIGSGLGFPTANLRLAPNMALPKDGVYATQGVLRGKTYAAVTNIGSNPTVNGRGTHIETHLLDFSGDAYGEPLEVRFLQRLRDETTFPNPQALSRQIAKDADRARKLLLDIDARCV